LRGRISI